MEGRIVSLHIAAEARATMQARDHVVALQGRGIEDDRYFHARGTWSKHPGTGREITLIESEALQAIETEYGITAGLAGARRNIVTAGVSLNHLVGREFYVGTVRLRGMRLCEPCAHLESLSVSGILPALTKRGGLRADILSGGIIRIGEPVTLAAGASIRLP